MLFARLGKMFPRILSQHSHAVVTAPPAAAFPFGNCSVRRSVVVRMASAIAGSTSDLPGESQTSPSSRPRLLYSIFEAPGHQLEDHVERPARVQGILRALTAAGFLGAGANSALSSQIKEIPPLRQATMEEIALIHSYGPELREKSAAATPQAPVALADLGDPDGVTYVTRSSWDNALTALGASLQLVDEVVAASKKPQTPTSNPHDPTGTPSGFAVIRPPGHHATPETPLGYCLLNNVAVAAKYAQQKHGLQRVLIVDIDVHNGNGTCEAFWEDDNVMVIDSHEENTVYPAPEFVPSGLEDIGAGPGEGLTINIPFPRYAGHKSMMSTMAEIVIPAARRFRPDLILVSAGYDAHLIDPFQLLQMRSSTYYAVAQQLRGLADEMCTGRIVFMLEGGYDVDALGDSVVETWLGLLGEPSREASKTVQLPQPEPEEDVAELLHRLKQIHKLL